MFSTDKASNASLTVTPDASLLQARSGLGVRGASPGLSDPLQQSLVLSQSSSAPTVDTALLPPDNSFGAANYVGTLSGTRTYSGFVGNTDTQDYYRLTLGTGGNLNIALSDLSADADVQLFNTYGSLITSSTRGGTYDESINYSGLAAGDYYVRVYQYSGNTNYTLQLSNTAPSNLLPYETNVGTLRGTEAFSSFVGNSDTSDIYRFYVGSTSNVYLSMTGLSADADLRVVRDSNYNGVVDAGEVIYSSTSGGSTSEYISLQGLGAGNYFAQVYQYSGNTNYNLSLSAYAGSGYATESNNIPNDAYSIGTLNGARTFSGYVGNTDTSDYYHFNLGTTSNVSLDLTGLSADADLRIIRDANYNGVVDAGETIYTSAYGGSLPESIDVAGLGAGSYLVQVYQYSGNTNYSLSLNATPGYGYAPESNNTLGTAYYMGNLNGSRTFTGYVGSTDTQDYYSFSLGTADTVNLSLSGLSADADLRLYNSSGTLVASSTYGGTTSESIVQALGAGTYYARVYQYSGDTSYTLNLSA